MLTFRSIGESELDEVAAFLRAVFGAPPDHPPFRRDVLHWKSIAPHPFWPGSRGYVYRDGEKIVAHGCVTPIEWRSASGTVRTACVVDWAADRTVPGIGLLLYRSIARIKSESNEPLLDGLTGIGGSDDARRVLPRAGFRQIFEMPVFSRIVRPLARNIGGPLDWKTPARVVRDWGRSSRIREAPAGWRVELVERFDESISPALPAPGRPSAIVARRSPELLNYWLACPAVVMEGYRAIGPANETAYFAISKRSGEARIADLGVSSNDSGAWSAALTLALRAAADPAIHTVKMATSAPLMQAALASLDFRAESIEPIFYWDASKRGIVEGECSITFADNDYFYLR